MSLLLAPTLGSIIWIGGGTLGVVLIVVVVLLILRG